MMRSGECSELVTPAHPTAATGSGSWHTPTAKDRFGSTPKETAMMVAHLTGAPVANTYKRLRSQVAAGMWPTPMAHDGKDCGSSPSQAGRNSPTLPVAAGGKLNPMWVEWLMGWPLGWTDLRASAMDRFRQWCDSHGVASG